MGFAFTVVLFLATIVGFKDLSNAADTIPQILYTDILYGPNSGGENNNGAYLSIFGRNFGNDINKIKAFINNTEIASYKYLGPSKGRPDIQQLSVQVGNLSTGAIYIVVNNNKSNSNHTFTVQPGKIWYVALTGNDTTGVANDIAKPFRTVQDNTNTTACVWRKVAPGDFIVLRGGDWQDVGLDNRFLRMKYNTGAAPTGAIGTGPITIMGYPGENVLIHSATSGGIHNRGNASEAKWITISGLRILGGDSTVIDGPINMQWGSDDWRIVNNELFDWAAQSVDAAPLYEARAGGIAGNGNRVRIFGNGIHGIGGGTKNHGIYIDFDGNPVTVDDIEIAWNHIYNHTGGNIIQTYGSLGPITNINIHHNLLHDGTRYGANLSDQTKSDIKVWNNIIYNISFSGLRFNTSNPQNVQIYNNVFYNVDTTGTIGGAIGNDWNLTSSTFEFKNNIVVPSVATAGYMAGSNWGGIFQRNLWYGKGMAPSVDDMAINSDPLFKNPAAGDFSFMSGSPAIDTGESVDGLINDYFGVSRPIDGDSNGISVLDIGPIETTIETIELTPPAPPTNLKILIP